MHTLMHMLKRAALGAGALALITLGGQAHAVPAFCTGTTTVLLSGQFVLGTFLVDGTTGTSTGNCIEASDKFFGGFNVGGAISGGGSAGWLFTSSTGPANVTIGFQGLVGPNSNGFLNYRVEIDPLKSNGALISALQTDFTFNSLGAGSTATLAGTTTPNPVSFTAGNLPPPNFSCTRTGTTSTCPETGFFNPLTFSLQVNQTLSTGPNTNVTAITDTVFQAVAVPEPASLLLLGTALAGLGWFTRRRRWQ